jgi:hypothetical protein
MTKSNTLVSSFIMVSTMLPFALWNQIQKKFYQQPIASIETVLAVPVIEVLVKNDQYENNFLMDNYIDVSGEISLLEKLPGIDNKYQEALNSIFHYNKHKFITSSQYKRHQRALMSYRITLRAYHALFNNPEDLTDQEVSHYSKILLIQLKEQEKQTISLLTELLMYERKLINDVLEEFDGYVNRYEG